MKLHAAVLIAGACLFPGAALSQQLDANYYNQQAAQNEAAAAREQALAGGPQGEYHLMAANAYQAAAAQDRQKAAELGGGTSSQASPGAPQSSFSPSDQSPEQARPPPGAAAPDSGPPTVAPAPDSGQQGQQTGADSGSAPSDSNQPDMAFPAQAGSGAPDVGPISGGQDNPSPADPAVNNVSVTSVKNLPDGVSVSDLPPPVDEVDSGSSGGSDGAEPAPTPPLNSTFGTTITYVGPITAPESEVGASGKWRVTLTWHEAQSEFDQSMFIVTCTSFVTHPITISVPWSATKTGIGTPDAGRAVAGTLTVRVPGYPGSGPPVSIAKGVSGVAGMTLGRAIATD